MKDTSSSDGLDTSKNRKVIISSYLISIFDTCDSELDFFLMFSFVTFSALSVLNSNLNL